VRTNELVTGVRRFCFSLHERSSFSVRLGVFLILVRRSQIGVNRFERIEGLGADVSLYTLSTERSSEMLRGSKLRIVPQVEVRVRRWISDTLDSPIITAER